MAEYREFHCPYGDDFEGGDECDRCEQYELCMEMPPTDVVEREKIDRAIEEIIEYRDDVKNDFCEVEVGAINGVLEILKKI